MALVQNISPLSVRAGGLVRLSGTGFDSACRVTVDRISAIVQDYGAEWLEFVAPSSVDGTATVRLLQNNVEQFSASLTVTSVEDSETWSLPVRGEEEFRNAQIGMMPRGFAWHTGKNGNWWKLFSAFASGFMAIYNSLRDLVDETSPIKTTSYSVWERELGLPLKGLEQSSAAGRKTEILRIARGKGGATVPYLKKLLNLYGARYDLYEYWKNSSVFPSWVARKYGEKAGFCVLIKVYQDHYSSHGFSCNSNCNGTLGGPNDYAMEAILDQEKPAHVKIIYRYFVRILTDMDGAPIVPSDNDQRMIIV